VQIGFAAEFSNIMIIYTRILEKPKEIMSCSAELIDFPEEVCSYFILTRIERSFKGSAFNLMTFCPGGLIT
jgi:hypothetical protein